MADQNNQGTGFSGNSNNQGQQGGQVQGAGMPVADSGRNEAIIAVRRNGAGDIIAVKTDQGNEYSLDQAVSIAMRGGFIGVTAVAPGRSDHYYLRSIPDGVDDNNLDRLPSF